MSIASKKGTATLEDFLAIPEGERFHELIEGRLVRKADPSGEHGGSQVDVVSRIHPFFQRPLGRGGPGGWWFASETEIRLASGDIVRPDVCGWRRERVPSRPRGFPVGERPDWICEIVSSSNASHDTVTKLRLYHLSEVPHYWLLDPRDATLTVMRWGEAGYTAVLATKRGETVRAEPFDAIEIEAGTLFGDDPSA